MVVAEYLPTATGGDRSATTGGAHLADGGSSEVERR